MRGESKVTRREWALIGKMATGVKNHARFAASKCLGLHRWERLITLPTASLASSGINQFENRINDQPRFLIMNGVADFSSKDVRAIRRQTC